MKSGFVMRQRQRRGIVLGVGVLALVLLPGCSDTYSSAVVYELRQDPFFKGNPPDMPADSPYLYKPDSPGQLPLMKLVGTNDARNPFFSLREQNEKWWIDPAKIGAAERKILGEMLDKMFGTPAKPRVNIPGAANDEVDDLKLDRISLAHGSKLYRLHCLTCHGISGDGRGPTAQWVNPHPRDYRAGKFKFQSVDQTKGEQKKPSREDLYRTLYFGVEGTSMPAFNLLTADELESLVSYVMHLSMRGELELQTYGTLQLDEKTKQLTTPDSSEYPGTIEALALKIFNNWKGAQKVPITVEPYPQFKNEADKKAYLKTSILRGQAMFLANVDLLKKVFPKKDFVKKYGKRFGNKSDTEVTQDDFDKDIKKFADSVSCVTCHGDYGRQIVWRFDEWGTMVKPANLTLPVYRGGRRPVDLYYRIHSGINGSGMLSFGNVVSGEQIWDLVNFLQVLPYPKMLKNEYEIDLN